MGGVGCGPWGGGGRQRRISKVKAKVPMAGRALI